MKLSIIDQSPVSAGSTPADALRNSIELARLADRLGYERYWIAEHHAITALASPAPEILMTRIAAETSGIRVGSGGVMLPHYSPLKVAEIFRMLHALYPGRIDLGVGRAPGGTPLDTFALQRYRGQQLSSDDFPQQLLELLAFLNRDFPAKHPFSRLTVSPDMPGCPEVWLLGSSMWSAAAAAQLGLRYAFAHFIDSNPTRAALEHYFSHFTASRDLSAPLRDGRAGRALRRHAKPRPSACSPARAFFAAASGRATCVRFRPPRKRSRNWVRRPGRRPPSSAIGRATSPARPRGFATS